MHLAIFFRNFLGCPGGLCHVGVPCVVSSAIEWAPKAWRAEPDSVEDVAIVGWKLLADPGAAEEGLRALRAHVQSGVGIWLRWLTGR